MINYICHAHDISRTKSVSPNIYENEISEKDNFSVIYEVIQSDINFNEITLYQYNYAISIIKLSADFNIL